MCRARAHRSAPSSERKTVGPHTIRQSTASHLLRAGVDLNTIRAWLGHVSINTTTIYAEIDLDTKALVLKACIPTTSRSRSRSWRSTPALMDFLRSLQDRLMCCSARAPPSKYSRLAIEENM
jgi:integrase/recombinase XerD